MTQNRPPKAAELLDAEFYRALLDQSPDGILITDQDGNLLDCNETAHRALGYTREEFEHLELSSLNTLPDPDEAKVHKQKVLEEGRTEFELSQRTREGNARDVLVTTQKLILPGRTLLHTTWHDISDCVHVKAELTESIQRLEKEKAKSEAIIHAIGEGISIRDRDFRILYQNQIMIDALGDHAGALCYRALHGRKEICEGCPVALSFLDGKIHTEERSAETNQGQQYFESIASPIRDASGKIIGAVELIRNITEKKRAEQALQEANSRMEALLNAIPDMVLFKDAQRRCLVVNRAVEQANGLRRQEMLGKVDEEFAPPEVAAMCRASDEKAMQAGGPVHCEESVVGENGETIFLDTIKAPMHDGKGNLAGVVVVSRDITERKKVEDALRLSGKRMFKAQQMAHVGNWEWTLGKDELYWSDEIYRIHGHSPESFTPTFAAVQEAMHPEDLAPFLRGLDRALHLGKPFEMDYRSIRPDGTERTIHTIGEVKYDSKGSPLGMSGTVQDITERKRLEAKTREQHATLESIMESTDNPIFSVDRRYCYTSFNHRHAAVMKDLYGADIALGKSILDFIPAERDRHQTKLGLDGALSGSKVISENYYGSEGQAPRLFESAFNPIRDTDGLVVGVALYARDTTARKRAEEQLKASEKRLRDITSNLGVGVYVMNDKGRIMYMNPMCEQLWGWSLEELQEKDAHNLIHCRKADGTCLPLDECEILKVIGTGQPYSSSDEVYVRKDGIVFPISVTASPLLEEGRIVASVTAFRDITRKRSWRPNCSRPRKLESVGILAGGIAHDFNNMLQAIMGSISLARMHLAKDNAEKIPLSFEQAEEASEAAKELSFRLLTFAKGGDPVKTILPLKKLSRNRSASS